MTRFTVWAPSAQKVDVQVEGERIPLEPGERGWWAIDVPEATAGSDYAFRLDEGEPLPDPRSPWQPHGVHGPSRVVDHGAFRWTDDGWQSLPLASAIIYELHVGTFTPEGTFEATINKLDYLRKLGITHIELLPVNEFAGVRGWGYDGVDIYAPHHAYGGPDGLKRLVDACHVKGLGVILDVVYNHFGPEGAYISRFGPYFTNRYSTPWGAGVNMDEPGSIEVRRFIVDNALMWLRDYHIDGLRLDGADIIIDQSAECILEQLASEVRELQVTTGRYHFIIAEPYYNDVRLIWPRQVGGCGVDAMWNDDAHHAIHALLTGERQGYYQDYGRLADLARVLHNGLLFDGRYSAYHDQRRGRPVTNVSGYQFVAFLQNHDQIGNRPAGQRIGQLAGLHRQRIGAALVFFAPLCPCCSRAKSGEPAAPFTFSPTMTTQNSPKPCARAAAKTCSISAGKLTICPTPSLNRHF
jgi:maltooligosyltrehalose trehalohydrolase